MESKQELRDKIVSLEHEINRLKSELKSEKDNVEKSVNKAIMEERNHQYRKWLSSTEGRRIQNLIDMKINEAISKLSLDSYSHGDAYYSESGIKLLFKGKPIASIGTDYWESEG